MIHNKILWLEDNLMSPDVHSIAILAHKFPLSRCWIIQSTNYTYAVISCLNDFDRFLRLIATLTKFSATSIRLYHHISYNKIPRFEDKLMSSHVHSIAMMFLPFFQRYFERLRSKVLRVQYNPYIRRYISCIIQTQSQNYNQYNIKRKLQQLIYYNGIPTDVRTVNCCAILCKVVAASVTTKLEISLPRSSLVIVVVFPKVQQYPLILTSRWMEILKLSHVLLKISQKLVHHQ